VAVIVPPAGQHVIDPARSRVTFTANHQLGLGTVRGSFALRSGEITIADPLTVVRAAVDAGSFASCSRARDKKVKSATFLHVENHPDISFESAGVRVDEEGTWTLHPGRPPRRGAG
jgi:polyisoprenoid-binding protein YceI